MPKRSLSEMERDPETVRDILPLKMVKVINLETSMANERGGGYGRQTGGEKQPVVEIYKEEIGGVKVFQCPFCNIKPLASDIRFRKHLKLHHPMQKILLRDSPRPTNTQQLMKQIPLQMFIPKQILPKVDGIVSLEMGQDELVTEKQTEKQALVIMEEGEDDDEDDYYILPEIQDGRVGLDAMSPISRSALQESHYLGQLETGLLLSPDRLTDTVYSMKKTSVTRTEEPLVSEQVCGVCGGIVEAATQDKEENEEILKVVGSVLGRAEPSELCGMCESVASDIAKTKLSIKKLQRRLTMAVNRLVDLASLGKRLLEEDLGQGGLCCPQEGRVAVRVVEEGRIEPCMPHLGLGLVAQYRGRLLGHSDVRADDGSCPESVDDTSDVVPAIYLSQGEWARAGLGMLAGEVQVPASLVLGLGAGKARARTLVSRALASDLTRPYFCMDCDHSFGALGALVDHCHTHTVTAPTWVGNSRHGDTLGDTFNMEEFVDALKAEEKNLVEQSRIKDLTHTDKYRIELRSYMHQEQFKDCQSEVPSLEKPFQCKECNKTFARAHDLWGHHASFRGPAFKCNFQSCEEVFLRLPDFAVHYAGHGGQQLEMPDSAAEKKTLHITCPICQTVVPGLYKLQRHKMKHDPELKYKCPACPKQFVKANTLRAHITNVHKSNKPQKKCKKCDVTVFSESGLYEHMKSEHGIENTYPCPTCGEIFLQESKLKEHSWSHINVTQAKVKNEQEDKALLSKTNNSKTLVSQCPECETDLLENETLTSHFASRHAGMEQRFQCSECGGEQEEQNRFITLAGARRHYRQVHRGKPHTCWVCKESFGREVALHLHLASAHPEVVGVGGEQGPVQCRYCDAVFSDHMERVSHTRYSHMVETIDITSTELNEVTMVGGHVIEFGPGIDQIVALHTIP